MREEKKLD
jgi:hypothetical protein